MKFINKYIAFVAFGAVSLASCNDDLNVASPSQMDGSMVYSTIENATNALNGVYVLFCEDPYTSRMSAVWMQNTDVEASVPTAGLPANDRRSVWALQGPAVEGFSDVYNAWNNCLQAIDRANQVVEGVDASSISSDPEMQQIKGEAICLKAYRYLLMCNFWGDVPYYDKAAVWGEEIDLPRTDRNIIYSKVLQQLVDIEPSMKFSDANVGGIERMNRDFAMGLIARIALFRAGYGKTVDGTMKRADDYLDVASDDNLSVTYTDNNGNTVTARTCADYYKLASNYCQKLINMKGRTLGDYSEAFDNEVAYTVVNNADVLYEVAFVESRGGDVGWCVGVANTGTCANGTTTAQVGLMPSYYMSFADNDVRRDVTCAKYSHSSDTIAVSRVDALGVGKWDRALAAKSLGSGSSKGTGINWPVMRYSDVLLMLAEAENEINNGPSALAKQALTQVRARAFKNSPTYSDDVTAYVNGLTGHDDFFKAIVDERAWEFGGEGLRRFDLIRWNLYAEKIEQTMRTLICWGISTNQDLMNLDNVKRDYPDAADYLGWADKLYYKKLNAKTNSIKEVEFLNDKYRLADENEADGYWYVNWGSYLISNVKTYEYQGTSYSACSKETITDEDGNTTVKYTLGVAPAVKEITINKGDDSGVTQITTYKAGDYMTRMYRGYSNGALTREGSKDVPFLLPIATTTLTSSNVLSNDGYGLKDHAMLGEGVNVIIGEIKKENY